MILRRKMDCYNPANNAVNGRFQQRRDRKRHAGEAKMARIRKAAVAKRLARRDFLKTSAGAAAFASFGIARKAFAAEPVNIGGLYPVTGSFAQSDRPASTPPNSRSKWSTMQAA
jgi:hypothetical protein